MSVKLKLNRDCYGGLQSIFKKMHGQQQKKKKKNTKTHKEIISVVVK